MTPSGKAHPQQTRAAAATPSRRAALLVLNRFDRSNLTLDHIIERSTPFLNDLGNADRALFNTLVYGVLRWRRKLDYAIARFSNTPVSKIEASILNILRLGAYQMLFLSRIPVSAAVNTAVELAKTSAPNRIVRFVNAVLRQMARKHQAIAWPEPDADPVEALAVGKSFPRWMIRRWIERGGVIETGRLCDALNTIAPLTLRTNTLQVDRDRLRQALSGCAAKIEPARFSHPGLRLLQPNRPVTELPGYSRGWFQVQDEAAQLSGQLLAPRPGERVLDACAGLGGKTGHLAQMMENNGEIIAVDVSRDRLQQLDEQMQRLGIAIVRSVCGDIRQLADSGDLGSFDRILVDAPCSGTGVIRRNPDTKWRLQKNRLAVHHRRQVDILNHLAALVRPPGRLVYAVCSIEPEENRMVVDAFGSRHAQTFGIEPALSVVDAGMNALIDADGTFRSMPSRHDMDGFFAACFKRTQ